MFSILLLAGPLEDMFCLLWRGLGTSHKVPFLSSRLFFPSEGRRAGSLVAAWQLAGCHEGWEKGSRREAKINCPGGWWFCLLALRHACVRRARICVGKKWRSLVSSLTPPPLRLMEFQHDVVKYRESSGA